MFARHTSAILALFSAAALAGCGGGVKRPPEVPSEHRPPVTRDFVENLDKVFAGDYLTPCEIDRKEKIYSVARRLDEFQATGGSTREAEANEFYRTVDYRGFKIRENLSPPGKNEWTSEESSWDGIIRINERIGPNPSAAKLGRLRRYLGENLSDDLYRTKWGSGYGLRHDNLDLVRGIALKAAECRRKSECQSSPFSAEEFRWLESQPRYRKLRELFAEKDFDFYLEQIAEDVSAEVSPDFTKNRRVHLDENGKLSLPLLAGEFSEMTDVLAGYIEPIWKDVATALHIEWKVAGETPDRYFFKLIMKQGGLGRSSVNLERHEVRLYSEVRSHSIAHEIGHVLGFPDRYYTYWDADKCAYLIDSNGADLMSEPDTGLVVAPDFETLRANYRI